MRARAERVGGVDCRWDVTGEKCGPAAEYSVVTAAQRHPPGGQVDVLQCRTGSGVSCDQSRNRRRRPVALPPDRIFRWTRDDALRAPVQRRGRAPEGCLTEARRNSDFSATVRLNAQLVTTGS